MINSRGNSSRLVVLCFEVGTACCGAKLLYFRVFSASLAPMKPTGRANTVKCDVKAIVQTCKLY